MKKRNMITAVGAVAGVGSAGYMLLNKRKAKKLKKRNQADADRFNDDDHTILNEAGIPDQLADDTAQQAENAKMVSEGSQFGVDYYNKHKNEDA